MKYFWTTKTGQKIDIDQMSETHLRNTLKMIVRNKQTPVASNRVRAVGNIESNFFEELCKEYEQDNEDFYL